MKITDVFIAAVFLAVTVVGMASTRLETSVESPNAKRSARKGRAVIWEIWDKEAKEKLDNEREKDSGCHALNTSCTGDYDCCSTDICIGRPQVCKKCIDAGKNCTGGNIDQCCHNYLCRNKKCVCTEDGNGCRDHPDCCGNSICINGKCKGCSNAGEPCEQGGIKSIDCCNGRCDPKNHVCYCSPAPNGPPCFTSLECCREYGDICLNGTCERCIRVNAACRKDEECCTKNCVLGVCNCKKKNSRKKRCTDED